MESESNGKFEDTVSSESDSSRQKTKARQVVGNLNVTHGEDMKCVDIFGHSEGDDGLEVANDEDYCIEKDLLNAQEAFLLISKNFLNTFETILQCSF